MRVLYRLVSLIGFFIATSYFVVVILPMEYLKIYSNLGFGPFSLPWVLDLAKQSLEDAPQTYCADPFFLSWQGSFGEFNLLPEGFIPSEADGYTKIILGQTDYITESTSVALTAMLDFNSQLVALCF